jgi:hypothetical protein
MNIRSHREHLQAAEDAWVMRRHPGSGDYEPDEWRARLTSARMQHLYESGGFTPQDLLDTMPPFFAEDDPFGSDPDYDINALPDIATRLTTEQLAIVARLLEVAATVGRGYR